MSDASDREAAFEELVRRLPHEGEPVLSANDLEGIVTNNQRAQRWTATTLLSIGAKAIMPTVRNGHVYRVIGGGTSGATEPTWPTGSEDPVVDGTVTLMEAGPDFDNVFDIRGAMQEVLNMMALRTIEFHAGDESRIHSHAKEAAREWATPLIG